MGAWIEIARCLYTYLFLLCRTPRWVRGLKFEYSEQIPSILSSHPTMGAWIEIEVIKLGNEFEKSHPTMGAWIEICGGNTAKAAEIVAPHDGCVD